MTIITPLRRYLYLAYRGGAASLTFLTIIPIGKKLTLTGQDVSHGAVAFPLVGGGVGAMVGLIDWWLGCHASAELAASLAVACGVVITGALHLDGLADFADGFGGHTVEDRLRIMRDHTIGVYGATALALDLLIRTSTLAAVAGHAHAVAAAAAAGAVSRSCGPVLAALLPYAQPPGGSGGALSKDPGRIRGIATTFVGLALAYCAVGTSAWRIAIVLLLAIAATVAMCIRRLGGVTGDVMGTTSELAEVAALVTMAGVL